MDQLFKSYAFTRVVRSQSTLPKPTLRLNLKNNITSGCNGCFLKFGVEESSVNALYGWLTITDQLFKSYDFTRVVRSQSTLQRQLRGPI
jgi:hypothetical protein